MKQHNIFGSILVVCNCFVGILAGHLGGNFAGHGILGVGGRTHGVTTSTHTVVDSYQPLPTRHGVPTGGVVDQHVDPPGFHGNMGNTDAVHTTEVVQSPRVIETFQEIPGFRPTVPRYRAGVGGAMYPRGITGAVYPGSLGSVYPGTVGGAVYPGTVGGAVYPGTVGGAVYPGTVRGAVYPETVRGAVYPSTVRGAVYPGTVGGAVYPGTVRGAVYPGTVRGAVYPNGISGLGGIGGVGTIGGLGQTSRRYQKQHEVVDQHIDLPFRHGNNQPVPAVHTSTVTNHRSESHTPAINHGSVFGGHAPIVDWHVDLPFTHGNHRPTPAVHTTRVDEGIGNGYPTRLF